VPTAEPIDGGWWNSKPALARVTPPLSLLTPGRAKTSGASPSGTGQSAAWSAPGEGSKSWPASSTTLPIFSSSAPPPS
jgi:hypothetical protein